MTLEELKGSQPETGNGGIPEWLSFSHDSTGF